MGSASISVALCGRDRNRHDPALRGTYSRFVKSFLHPQAPFDCGRRSHGILDGLGHRKPHCRRIAFQGHCQFESDGSCRNLAFQRWQCRRIGHAILGQRLDFEKRCPSDAHARIRSFRPIVKPHRRRASWLSGRSADTEPSRRRAGAFRQCFCAFQRF